MAVQTLFTMSRKELSVFIKNWTFWAVLLANVVLVSLFIVHKMGSFPIGWDAPYYISRVRYFEDLGVLSNRTGFITLMSTFHVVLGIPLVTLYMFFTVGAITLLSGASAFLASRLFPERRLPFLLTFLAVSWYTPYFALSASTFDNALGLFFMLSALVFFASLREGWKGVALFTVAAVMTLLTHLESYLLLLLILVIYAVVVVLSEKSLRMFFRRHRPYILMVILTILLAVIQWADVISVIFSHYANPVDQSLNAAIPYSQSRSLHEFVQLLSTGIPNLLYIVVFLIGIAVTYVLRTKENTKKISYVLLAYLVGAYSLLLYSVLRSSIPLNRSVLLLPVPVFIGIGLTFCLDFFYRRLRLRALSSVAILFILIVFPVPAYWLYVQKFPVSISTEVFHDFVTLNDYVVEKKITDFILITNTDPYTTAASAYYGLWHNWIESIFPLEDGVHSSCVYFGTLENFSQLKPTVRSANNEYNETNIDSLSCIQKLPATAEVFMIKGLYAGNVPSSTPSMYVKQISPRVLQITFFKNNADIP